MRSRLHRIEVMARKSSSSMRLPTDVRAAALAAVGGTRLQKEFAWMSWAGTVWRLEGQNGAVYVKRAGDLKDEHDRTAWLAGRLPVPEVLGMFRGFHAVDATGCPFGVPQPGHVLIHGDYCLPNVLVEDGRLSALIDLGLAGLGDPQVDLAAGVWTLQYNFGPGHASEFLDAYGWPPMSDKAIERLRRRYSR